MLRGLDITDMLLIDRLELGFQAGLNVLTGETGAGKSILLDSLGFVLGWRGRADLVRQGAAQGEVTAWFDLTEDHPAYAILEEAGLPSGDELLLRRVNTADGRKTAWVNDKRVSGETLRRLSETLVELHGQHDDRGLLNTRGHRALLDAFGGHDALRDETRAAWRARRVAMTALAEADAAMQALREEEDFLRHATKEMADMGPEAGEDAALDARRRLMQGAERMREDLGKAHQVLGQDGAEGAMSDAMRWMEGVADRASEALDAPIAALGRAFSEVGTALDGIGAALDQLQFNPSDLELVEERLFALRALARKHDVLPDDLPALAETLSARLAALDASDADRADLEQAVAAADQRYSAAAEALSAARRKAAAALDRAVTDELAPLKMERAVFTTQITQDEPGPEGQDAVAFTVATNPGAPSGALNKIASGGELSRFLLALKVCLSRAQTGVTMIFDEIDRGVGGATADAVGRRLAQLAEAGQVLVVTHSPQVAAQGAHHWRVEKSVQGGMTTSRVVPLDAPARVDEIARMVAGDRITEEARGAARALLGG